MPKLNNSIVIDFINKQNHSKHTIAKIYEYGFVDYQEGMPLVDKNNVDISTSIEKLREMDVLDYDGYNSTLHLTENYEKHLFIFSDTNIAEIDKKIKNISKLIRDIDQRLGASESSLKEERQINSNLRNIKKTILMNISSLNSIQLQFKGESNIEIRKNNLNECKDELEILSKALKRLNTFMRKNTLFLCTKINNEAIKHELNTLKSITTASSSNIIKILNELTMYLNQIEKEAKKIEHINRIYKLKYSNELYEKTDIEEIVRNKIAIIKLKKIKKIYYNDEELVDLVKDKHKTLNNTNTAPITIPIETSEPIGSVSKTVSVQRKTISTKAAYKKFTLQEEDLATFLVSLEIDRKKFIGLFVRIVMGFNAFLHISDNTIITMNYSVPVIHKGR